MLISGGNMFLGQYNTKIDKRGFIVLPSKLREELKNPILVVHIDGYLTIYSVDEWEVMKDKLTTSNFEEDLLYLKQFVRNIFVTTYDERGRIKIDSKILDKVNIKDECVIIGALNKIEIWNKEKWQEFQNNHIKYLPEIYDLFHKK